MEMPNSELKKDLLLYLNPVVESFQLVLKKSATLNEREKSIEAGSGMKRDRIGRVVGTLEGKGCHEPSVILNKYQQPST